MKRPPILDKLVFMLDINQLNRIINIKWNRNDIVSIEVTIKDTSRDGIAVQTNQEIEQGRTVTNNDGFPCGVPETKSLEK